jgi:cytochrome c biogenesis protein CcmG, thiol:disulfide interchange protein DsbE
VNARILATGLLAVVPLVGVLAAGLGRDPRQAASPLIGRQAPAFVLPALGGSGDVSLEAFRGRPFVLNFWASWCVPCREEHDALQRAAAELDPGVAFLGIAWQDDAPSARAFLERHGSVYPSALDGRGNVAIAYGVAGVPETFFVDAQGVIAARYVGPVDARVLTAQIARLRSLR